MRVDPVCQSVFFGEHGMGAKPPSDQFPEQEAQRRTETALRAAFTMPPKPQSEMKVGRTRRKPKKSPVKRKAK